MKETDITKEILPLELNSLFNTFEYENYGIFKIDKISFESNVIEFCFTIQIKKAYLKKEKNIITGN